MGKGEEASKDESDEDTASTEETPKPSNESAPQEKVKAEELEDTKNDKNDLRKIIKLDSTEVGEKEQIKSDLEATPRESLEQKRMILQSIKDFGFLIKENQEDIGEINKKLDSITQDLDDLVSLYEIVSEQMNPFVGLSKVTKKRIDALENFTKEIEDLKERTGELESFAERSGVKLKSHNEREREHVKTKDTSNVVVDEKSGEDNRNIEDAESSGELTDKEIRQPEAETDVPNYEADGTILEEIQEEETQQPTTPEEISIESGDINIAEELQQPISVSTISNNIWEELSDDDLDVIIERTIGGLSPEGKIDMIIDEFIESLKD